MDTDADKPPSGTMEDTFTLQVLSQSVGVNGPLTLPDLPVTTTVAELKSKIRDKLLPASADEARQRLIYRGRLLIRSDETMRELFGNETLKNHPVQSLHLALRPADDPTTASSQQSQNEPSLPTTQTASAVPDLGSHSYLTRNRSFVPTMPRNIDEPVDDGSSTRPIVYILSSPEGPRAILITDSATYHTPRTGTVPDSVNMSNSPVPSSTSVQGTAIGRLPTNLNDAATEAGIQNAAMQLVVGALRSQIHFICEYQLRKMEAFDRTRPLDRYGFVSMEDARAVITAAMRVAETEQQLWHQLPSHNETPDERSLWLAHRAGFYYLRAQQRFLIFTTVDDLILNLRECQAALRTYVAAIQRVHHLLARNPGSGEMAALEDRALELMLDPEGRPREPTHIFAPQHLVPLPPFHNFPLFGHGMAHRQAMAGRAVRMIPYVWFLAKVALFAYAFLRFDDSWSRIFTIAAIGVLILLNGFGAFQNVGRRVMETLQGLLEREQIMQRAQPGRDDGAQAQRGHAAEPRRAPLAEQADQDGQNRTWLTDHVQALHHAVLLFITSIVPGVGERHVAQRNAAAEARRRAQEEAEAVRRRAAEEETMREHTGQSDAADVGGSGGGNGAASGAVIATGADNAQADQNAEEQPQPTRTQPMEAYVEDEFGGVD